MADQQNVNMMLNADPNIIRYMETNNTFMRGLARHFEANDESKGVPIFSGGSAENFRDWMRCMDRIFVDHPGDHDYMRKIVTKTVRDLAADYFSDLKQENQNNPNDLTWPEIRQAFYDRFSNYVDAQIAQQKLKKLKQEKKQGLHSYAQVIKQTANEAYNAAEMQNPIVIRELKDIFINGLRDHKMAQNLIKDNVQTLHEALQRAIRDDLLQQTYKLRSINNENEHEPMDCSAIENQPQSKPEVTQDQFNELSVSVAAIAAAIAEQNHTKKQYKREFSNEKRQRNSKFKWTSKGQPICFHCNKEGHMQGTCWIKHPELRPKNNKPRPTEKSEN